MTWKRNGTNVPVADLQQIVIAFNGSVMSADLHAQSVRMLVPDVTAQEDNPLTCWCQFPALPVPWELTTQCDITQGGSIATGTTCNAVALTVDTKELRVVIENATTASASSPIGGAAKPPNTSNTNNNISNTVRIQVHGDMIADAYGNGLDGNQLPPFLPTKPTGDGIPGGLFESWFHVEL